MTERWLRAVFIESATGIREGGRTGLTALVTAFCFFISLFFAPLLGMTQRARPLSSSLMGCKRCFALM